ncbi:MAG: RdgB/HAM1 family non-canonical purine NTP pyrophosphatase [Candidatus Aenigmarchaeota archaeon]|nr:RdgB/HAM1 family non-canonical purine NTP pyrophosphatase [Candidatus Aenigmarchaeota archaeon]
MAGPLLFITGNRMKAEEVKEILAGFGIAVEQRSLDIGEIQEKDAEPVAREKARHAFSMVKKPLIVEDTGLYIRAMNGYPGTLIKHFFESIGPQGIVDFLKGKDRSAEAVTVFAYCDPEGRVRTFRGSVSGRISDRVTKGYDFAWDTIFIPEGYERTYAEIGTAEKNGISQRRLALESFAKWLKEKGEK